VSVGEEDHVKPAVQAEGQLDLWLVAMKPGKPVAFGRVNDPAGGSGADFIGLPGNPVSSFVTFLMLVRPFILRRMGVEDCLPKAIRLPAGFDWPRPDRRREFLRARVGEAGRSNSSPTRAPACSAPPCGPPAWSTTRPATPSPRASRSPSFPIPNCCHEHQGPVLRQPARNPRLLPRNPHLAGQHRHPRRPAQPSGRRGGVWEALGEGRNVRAAINQEMAGPDAAVADRDEIAFFPVTGG
jgi:molybdopterin molybdotransferase